MSPTRVLVDDDEQQIADMLRQVRRLRSRLASVTPRGGHDTFTAAATPATTYQLSVIPILGTCLMALNGHVQREGTDYTVDYSVGLVTVSASQASGDKVVFRYLITDWLVARSLTPEMSTIADDFNRTNSATNPGSTSVGNLPWTNLVGTVGISSNRAYPATYAANPTGSLTRALMSVDVGNADGTLQMTAYTTAVGDVSGGLAFRVSGPHDYWLYGGTGVMCVSDGGGFIAFDQQISSPVSNGDVLKIVLAGSSITAYRNGVLQGTFTDTRLQTVTKHGVEFEHDGTSPSADDWSWTSP